MHTCKLVQQEDFDDLIYEPLFFSSLKIFLLWFYVTLENIYIEVGIYAVEIIHTRRFFRCPQIYGKGYYNTLKNRETNLQIAKSYQVAMNWLQ